MIDRLIHNAFNARVSIAPLVTFRFLFGAIMFVSQCRFFLNGWIEAQYIAPQFHFKYFGFHWIPDFSPLAYYVLFGLIALSSLGIAFGALYRLSGIIFFLAFTCVELVDVTYYLNHYYFISLAGLLLIFLPANRMHSLDLKLGLAKPATHINAIGLNILKFQLALVYFFAGVAKINADWLLEAMPLALWLPAQDQLPLIGWIMPYRETAYLFSWAGALYDLSIPFLLLTSRFRWPAYAAVVIFHLLTWSLFQIGMFPFIMIGATLVFFSPSLHLKIHRLLGFRAEVTGSIPKPVASIARYMVMGFVVFQLLFPLRHVLYPGNMYWHEQGYRFGWRVMLMEKAGYAQFKVSDAEGREIHVDNGDFLTPVQEKMMSTQPDLILQYAHHLQEYYMGQGMMAPAVRAEVYVTMNGRQSRPFIDPSINLCSLQDGWKHKDWIMPIETKGKEG